MTRSGKGAHPVHRWGPSTDLQGTAIERWYSLRAEPQLQNRNINLLTRDRNVLETSHSSTQLPSQGILASASSVPRSNSPEALCPSVPCVFSQSLGGFSAEIAMEVIRPGEQFQGATSPKKPP